MRRTIRRFSAFTNSDTNGFSIKKESHQQKSKQKFSQDLAKSWAECQDIIEQCFEERKIEIGAKQAMRDCIRQLTEDYNFACVIFDYLRRTFLPNVFKKVLIAFSSKSSETTTSSRSQRCRASSIKSVEEREDQEEEGAMSSSSSKSATISSNSESDSQHISINGIISDVRTVKYVEESLSRLWRFLYNTALIEFQIIFIPFQESINCDPKKMLLHAFRDALFSNQVNFPDSVLEQSTNAEIRQMLLVLEHNTRDDTPVHRKLRKLCSACITGFQPIPLDYCGDNRRGGSTTVATSNPNSNSVADSNSDSPTSFLKENFLIKTSSTKNKSTAFEKSMNMDGGLFNVEFVECLKSTGGRRHSYQPHF